MNEQEAIEAELLQREISSRETTEVPKWGVEHPNVYGIAEAGKAIAKPLVSAEEFEGTSVTGGKILAPAYQTASRAVGAMGGGAGPQFGQLLPGFLQQKMGAKVASGETSPLAIAGNLLAVGGLAKQPVMSATDYDSLLSRGLSTVEGKAPTNWFDPKKQLELAEETRKSLNQVKHGAVESYGIDYDKYVKNSDKVIDTKNIVNNFVQDAEDSFGNIYQEPDFLEAIAKKDPLATRIKGLIDKVNNEEIDVSQEISVQEADRLQKWIKGLPGIKNKIGKGGRGFSDMTNSERLLVGLANDIKASVIEAHPELSATNKAYGETMNDIKNVRKFLRFGTATENLKNYHGMNIEPKLAFQRVLPSGVMKKITDLSSAIRNANIAKQLAKITGIGGAVGGLIFGGR